MTEPLPKRRFELLDAMRGVAALLVVQRHVPEFFGFQLQSNYLAVDLFFVLSGFVICHAYEEKLSTGRMSVRGFIVARLLRLYPLYIAGLVLITLFHLANYAGEHNTAPLSNFLSGFVFGAVFLPAPLAFSFNLAVPFILGTAWSLFC